MYYKVVCDILEHYNNYINSNEIKVLNKLKIILESNENNISDEIIIFINKIIDRIWNLTLTDIKDYVSGEPFIFLVKETRFWIENDKLIDVVTDEFKLLTDETIKKNQLDEVGIIISPNFTNNLRTTPILPIHFIKNKRIKNFNYDKVGYYTSSLEFSDICAASELITDESINNKKPIIHIDKTLYRSVYNEEPFTLGDIEEIISMYVGIYLIDYKKDILSHESFKLKNKILNKKRSITKLIMSYYNKEITKEELKELIYRVIKKEDNNLTNKKQ